MYVPPAFREDRLEVLHTLIKAQSLGTLITAGEGGLEANLVPFILLDDGGFGTLRAHIAKANDQLRALRQGAETLVVFKGPDTYITPSWYATNTTTGQVVPTWNYIVVQARGVPRVVDDPRWLREQIEQLTQSQERSRKPPWNVAQAPEAFIAAQMRGIVGIEIPIVKLEGKWKVSQNRSDADRESVVEGLRGEGNDVMARLVEEFGKRKRE